MIESKTAGGIIINNDNVLVVEQKHSSWSLPKGHIEVGETVLEAAKREIYEESGITDLTFVKELGTYQRYKISKDKSDDLSELKTITIFLFTTTQTKLEPQDPENPSAIWLEKDKVADKLTHKKDKEFFLSIINEI
jgi:ADP-ribose pyrophosphatase YjhB (NUDIX family)